MEETTVSPNGARRYKRCNSFQSHSSSLSKFINYPGKAAEADVQRTMKNKRNAYKFLWDSACNPEGGGTRGN